MTLPPVTDTTNARMLLAAGHRHLDALDRAWRKASPVGRQRIEAFNRWLDEQWLKVPESERRKLTPRKETV